MVGEMKARMVGEMRVRKATRDALLAKVRTRLDRFVATQDPAVVLAPAAVGEVRDLLKTVSNPATDLEIMATAGFLHWFRYQALPVGEDQEDLLAALMFFEPVYQAVPELVPEPLLVHLDPARTMAARARELLRRMEAAVDPAALDEAVDLLQQAVAATPKDHPRLPVHLGDLDDALERRFELKGERADIDAAVDVCRRAVAAVPAGHPDHAGALSNLGNALGLRFERGGDPADLDQAIEVGSAAEAAAGVGHPARVQILANLGSNLVLRADRDSTEADVGAAVGYLRQAAALLPPGHPARPPVTANLANALFARWELLHDSADLAESIRLCQEALAAVPPGHPKREGILLTLSKALHDRGVELMAEYGDSADLTSLNAAIPASHVQWAWTLSASRAVAWLVWPLVAKSTPHKGRQTTYYNGCAARQSCTHWMPCQNCRKRPCECKEYEDKTKDDNQSAVLRFALI